MPRATLCIAIAVALLLTHPAHAAKGDVDMTALKRTCDALLGTQFDSPSWRRLRAYVQDRRAFDNLYFICGAGWCSNTIPLRGGISLEFRCNAARVTPGEVYTAWAPDEMIVYFVTLKQGDHTIYHRERRSIRKA